KEFSLQTIPQPTQQDVLLRLPTELASAHLDTLNPGFGNEIQRALKQHILGVDEVPKLANPGKEEEVTERLCRQLALDLFEDRRRYLDHRSHILLDLLPE